VKKIYIGRSEKYNYTHEASSKEDVHNEMSWCEDLVITETTETEVLMNSIPEEFRSVLSYMAYERGHAYGDNEVELILRELIHNLKPAIDKYTERVLKTNP
jgi:hypothetical protein